MTPNFFEWIKREAARRGMNLTEFSKRSGIPYQTFFSWQRGLISSPRLVTLQKIAHALGLTIEELEAASGLSRPVVTAA